MQICSCMFCGKIFGNIHRLSGHLGRCQLAKDSRHNITADSHINVVEDDMFRPWMDGMGLDLPDYGDDYQDMGDNSEEGSALLGMSGTNEYLDLQKLCMEKDMLEFKTGYCLTRAGTYAKGCWKQYIAICQTFESCAILSSGESNSLLTLIKFLCEGVGALIGLPSVYRQIVSTVMSSTMHRQLTILKGWVKPPEFLFGTRTGCVRPSPFVYHDILQVIAQQLLDNKIVGNYGENFAVDFELKEVNGERIISDFHTAEYMRMGSEWVKENIGPNVKLLPIIISSDKTLVSEGSTKTAFPCYVSIGNLKLDVMCKDGSTELIGYLPELVDSISVLHSVLSAGGCTSKALRKEAISVFKRHLEQEVNDNLKHHTYYYACRKAFMIAYCKALCRACHKAYYKGY
jgi:hypothetical protein